MDMQRLLSLDLTSAHEIVRQPTTHSNIDGTKLCGLICAYRLLDVNAWIGGRTPLSSYVAPPLEKGIKLVYVRISFIQSHCKIN